MRFGRQVVMMGLVCVAFGAGPRAEAQEGRYNGHCSRLTRQISQFEGVADRAREREDSLWLASTAAHLERLHDRRSRLCPEYDRFVERARTEQFWRETYALTLSGAKAAMRYFTFGMY